MDRDEHEIRNANTQHILAALDAEESPAAELLPQVYDELRGLAERFFREQRADHTLQATALVHEAYCKLVDVDRVDWRGRSHFFAVATTAMRQVLIDHFRSANAQKRGGGWRKCTLDTRHVGDLDPGVDMLAIHEALSRLTELDPRQGRVVELRFFGGLTNPEIAEVLDVSLTTVEGEWRHARAWLARELAIGE